MLKVTNNESVDLTHLRLEEAVPEMQIEIYRHLRTGQFYVRYLDGRLEPLVWPQTGACREQVKNSGISSRLGLH